jgi:hypothetical protein
MKNTISFDIFQLVGVRRKFHLSHWSLSQVSHETLCNMDSDDIQEIQRIMHRHEELIQSNRSVNLSMLSKFSKIEQACINKKTNTMSILVHQN